MRNSLIPAFLSLLVAGGSATAELSAQSTQQPAHTEHAHEHAHVHDHAHAHEHAHSLAHDHSHHEVLLPVEKADHAAQLLAVRQAPSAELWADFKRRNGDWSVVLDPATLNPRQAIGKPIPIEGFAEINSSNVEVAARRFLQLHAAVFNVNVDQLEFVRATPIGTGQAQRWYVSMAQEFNKLSVLYSEVELRINSRAEVFAFRLNTFPDVQLNTQASLAESVALATAVEGLSEQNKKGITFSADAQSLQLHVLPIVHGQHVDYHLVYKLKVYSNHPGHRYDVLVDAHDGALLRRQARCLHIESKVNVNADVRTGLRNEPTEIVPLQSLQFEVAGQTYVTDANGDVTIDIPADSEVEFELSGPFITVEAQGAQTSKPDFSLTAGRDQTLSWTDENSHRFERNMFYHGNRVYQWHKQNDPASDAMDIQVVIQLWFQGDPFGGQAGNEPNAFSNRDTIAFLGLSNTTMAMADGGSVLYHEYGHSINNIFADKLGGTFDNAAAQEGIADVVAAFIEDQPEVGLGVFTGEPNRSIRNAVNDLRYPDDLQGESHADGQIISGAFWDLRNLTNLETATRLLHFARYGLPDDPDNGMVFGEWFMEVLIADDDDGNLGNGTPHCDEILEAFNRHNIGDGLFLQTSFAHTPLPNTDDTENDYQANFSYNSLGFKSGEATTTIAEYWTNRNPQRTSVQAIGNETDGFSVIIPAQARGTLVNYSIYQVNAQDEKTMLSGAGAQDGVYTFLVGYDRIAQQNFENAEGWTLGVNSDRENAARWEIADPERVYLPDLQIPVDLLVQPEDDHSPVGRNCLVTGARAPRFGFAGAMVSMGRTTAISPAYELQTLQVPVIQLHYWFATLIAPVGGPIQDPEFRIDVSDDGETWQSLRVITESTDGWSKLLLEVPPAFDESSEIRLRFVVDPRGDGFSFANALVDDIELLALRSSVSTDVKTSDIDGLALLVAPNPVVDQCSVSIDVARSGTLSMAVVDLFGNKLHSWTPGFVAAGTHRHVWNLTADGESAAVAAGTYFIQIGFDGQTLSRQLQIR